MNHNSGNENYNSYNYQNFAHIHQFKMPNKGRLFLIPNAIAENSNDAALTQQLKNLLPNISHFLAEDVRSARRYLSSLKIYPSIEPLQFSVLNKDTPDADIPLLMEPALKGLDIGVISESGCPGIADPGSLAVRYAHLQNIRVIPLVGPSSILLA